MEPAIAGRFTAVWIGGPEHPGLGAPAFPGADPEYNLNIDIAAAQVVFNDSAIDLCAGAAQRLPPVPRERRAELAHARGARGPYRGAPV